jgi:hypothetical protein
MRSPGLTPRQLASAKYLTCCLRPRIALRKLQTVKVAETRYARSGDVNIAYQVVGEGPLDLIFVLVISHLELMWESRR